MGIVECTIVSLSQQPVHWCSSIRFTTDRTLDVCTTQPALQTPWRLRVEDVTTLPLPLPPPSSYCVPQDGLVFSSLLR